MKRTSYPNDEEGVKKQPRRRRKRGYKQGWYTPRNPGKYRGDSKHIRYMSSWELHAHRFLDGNPNVLEWSSEEIAIPYVRPTDRRVHRYFPDYWVKYKDAHGRIYEEIWEVKPAKEISQPTRVGKSRKQQLLESITYAINVAKWKAAQTYCRQHGYKFRIITETHLFK